MSVHDSVHAFSSYKEGTMNTPISYLRLPVQRVHVYRNSEF
jgi:hypothetical protein